MNTFRCGEGRILSDDGQVCKDVNECKWNPCLYGSTCKNINPGTFLDVIPYINRLIATTSY